MVGNDGTYKEYDIFYGHKVSSLQSPVYDTDNHLIIDYETEAATLQLGDLTPNSDGVFFGHDSDCNQWFSCKRINTF